MITLHRRDKALILPVRVTPKGGRDCILPFKAGDSEIRLKVSAPPEDGKANAAVIRLLAQALGLGKSRVKLIKGEKSRSKQLEISLDQSDEATNIARMLANGMQSTPETCFELSQIG